MDPEQHGATPVKFVIIMLSATMIITIITIIVIIVIFTHT